MCTAQTGKEANGLKVAHILCRLGEGRLQLEGKSKVMKKTFFVGERFQTFCRWINRVSGKE